MSLMTSLSVSRGEIARCQRLGLGNHKEGPQRSVVAKDQFWNLKSKLMPQSTDSKQEQDGSRFGLLGLIRHGQCQFMAQ